MPLSEQNEKILEEEKASSLSDSEIDSIIEKKIAEHGILNLKYLFSWNEISENNDGKLKDFLKQRLGIGWVNAAKIEKIESDKTIKVTAEENTLLLRLNDEKTRLNLKIDNVRTYVFIVKTENGKLNIYTGIEKEEMLYLLQDNLRRVWKIKFSTKEPVGAWFLFLDKTKGNLIEEQNLIMKVTIGRGNVFDPNPVVALDKDDLYGNMGPEAFKDAYLREAPLNDLDGNGSLKGTYVDTTVTKNPAYSSNHQFLYERKDLDGGFEQVMVYYHITEAHRYINQKLKFKDNEGVLSTPHPIKVNAHGGSYFEGGCYNPINKSITFCDGIVNSAEDAEIILHEYGHAILDAVAPNLGGTSEQKSISEGFADYFAASFFEEKKMNNERKYRIAEWYAKGSSKEPQIFLRTLRSDKRYKDRANNPRVDCEIWSSCLWMIRELLGKEKADSLILHSLKSLNNNPKLTFFEGAKAIIVEARNLRNFLKLKEIEIQRLNKIFEDRGIF